MEIKELWKITSDVLANESCETVLPNMTRLEKKHSHNALCELQQVLQLLPSSLLSRVTQRRLDARPSNFWPLSAPNDGDGNDICYGFKKALPAHVKAKQ